ncbi:efflux transporter outer membrane subunit [Vibrio sp. SCSIO 43137]|uniref:efflux transporter outer membrane subunit n=1 Tax=Vibrio sp. SCSIO 43137 TaxID=3021011 RepID=UPI002307ADEC|nr:TolC family protein [Vibrio sp. SCSIO 43137]WCE32491.1 TolC family protein [Vibrio sp. SCSIO 43137]
MNTQRLNQKGITLCLIALLAGCSSLDSQQHYSQQANEVLVPDNWSQSDAYQNRTFTNQLLTIVDQPSVSELVKQTLAANYDLRRTAITLKQAQLLQVQSGIAERPSLDAKYSAQRAKQGKISSSQTVSLDLSWELDVWGRLADATDASIANTRAAELDLQAARNSLAARVVQAWLDIVYRAEIIRVEQEWVKSLTNTEEIIKEQVLDGVKEPADLDTARAETEKTRATLANRIYQQKIAMRKLNVLRGRSDHDLSELSMTLPDIAHPPVQLPGKVIGSRPDLIAAYQRVLQADKNTSVAYKELLPKFTLTASVSRTGNSMDQLLNNSSAWSLLGNITAPLFNRDKLKTSAEIEQLKAESSYLAYQNTLLNALSEVENAFDQEASYRQQQSHLKKALDFSLASMGNYQERYQDGVSDILTLLTAKQSAFQARIQLLQTEQARFSNRITLGLALGMGV